MPINNNTPSGGGNGQKLIPSPIANDIVTVNAAGQVIDSGRAFYDGDLNDVGITINDIPNAVNVKAAIDAASTGFIKIVGNWDASTNTPTLTAGIGIEGQGYYVSVAGTQTLPFGTPKSCAVNDVVYYPFGGGNWQLIPASAVTSVNGMVGAVSLGLNNLVGVSLALPVIAQTPLVYNGSNWINQPILLSSSAAVNGILPNSNTTATSSNTINTIVSRDGSGNFSAGTITATLIGTASLATNVAGGGANQIVYNSASNTTTFLSPSTGVLVYTGSALAYTTTPTLTGTNFSGIPNSATTATSSNTINTIVSRDGSGNFSAGTISAALSGNATTATTATNIAGGTSGQAVIQTGVGTTGFFNYSDINSTSTIAVRNASGALLSDIFAIDATSYWQIQSGSVVFTADANDYINYDRSNNNYQFFIGGSSRLQITSTTLNSAGDIVVGGSNTTVRIANASPGTGTSAIIDVNGDIRPLTSSQNFKTNIVPLTIDFSQVNNFQPIEYDYRDEGGHDFGYLAESIYAIMPNLVNLKANAQGQLIPYSIKYDRLGVVAIEYIKYIQQQLTLMGTPANKEYAMCLGFNGAVLAGAVQIGSVAAVKDSKGLTINTTTISGLKTTKLYKVRCEMDVALALGATGTFTITGTNCTVVTKALSGVVALTTKLSLVASVKDVQDNATISVVASGIAGTVSIGNNSNFEIEER